MLILLAVLAGGVWRGNGQWEDAGTRRETGGVSRPLGFPNAQVPVDLTLNN